MELSTTLAAISSAKDFAALIIGRKIDAAVTEKAIDLQNAIIGLQSGLLEMQAQIQTLTQQKRELEREAGAVKDWAQEEGRHELVAVAKGVHVVKPLSSATGKESVPWYCANCWQKQFKSVLQRTGQDYGGTHYYCPNCSAKIYDHSEYAQV